MAYVRGCCADGPQIFFDENPKDFAKSFWIFASDFGFPEMANDPIAGARSFVGYESSRVTLLKKLLAGGKVELKAYHILCRVSKHLVPDQAHAKDLLDEIFHKGYSGEGYFRDVFLPLDYEVLPETLKVNAFDVQKPPSKYADLMPQNSQILLMPYSTVLDISFDVRLQLLKSVPLLDRDQLKSSYIYSDEDVSLYSAIRSYLNDPEKVWISQTCKTCGFLPECEADSDQFFLQELFRENPLTLYTLSVFVRDFSANQNIRKSLREFPDFYAQGSRNDQFNYEKRFFANVKGAYSSYFEGFVAVSLGFSIEGEYAIEVLQDFGLFLYNKIRELHTILERETLSLPWNWDRVFSVKKGANQIMLWPMSADDSILKKVKKDAPKVRQCLTEFVSCLENLDNSLGTLKTAIEGCVTGNLKQNVGEMIISSIKNDPVQYMEYPVPAIRKYVNGIINGEFFRK